MNNLLNNFHDSIDSFKRKLKFSSLPNCWLGHFSRFLIYFYAMFFPFGQKKVTSKILKGHVESEKFSSSLGWHRFESPTK